MTLFQAGAYQSKVLSYVVRQTRHWVEQGAIALGRLKVAATWGTQILLYPAYLAFQSVRLAAAHVKQVWALGVPTFRAALRSQSPAPPPPPATESSCETPIRRALDTLRTFELPVRLPVLELPILGDDRPLDRPPGLVSRTIAAVVKVWDQVLGIRSPAAVRPPPPPVYLQGIATCITTRSLVLVTNQNELLDILTPTQQKQLRDRIIGEVAVYCRWVKSLQAERGKIVLRRSRDLVRAVRPLWSGARSTLQFLMALFYALFYSARRVAQQLQPAASLQLSAPSLFALEPEAGLILPWTADLPIQQAFRLVQQFVLPTTPEQIRGIACQLEGRSLVLVTDQNQILDVLTEEQQTSLRRRITWDTAHYGRYRQIRQRTRQAVARLQSSQDDRLFAPIRILRSVMAWMQISRVAIATNLFQEASLVLSPITTSIATPIATLSAQLRPEPAPVMQLVGATDSVPLLGPAAWISSAASLTAETFSKGTATRSPNYIETQATPLGYVQTPIEAILRWIDRFLLWLEKSLILFWRWLQQQF